MKPFEAEQLLIAHVVQFGNDAARICLPQLTPDKFCFSMSGEFGIVHSQIWSAIRKSYLNDNISPTLDVLRSYMGEEQYHYLTALPHQHQLDPLYVDQLAQLVDKTGLVYNVSKHGYVLGNNLKDTEHFMQVLDSISDIEAWVSHQLDRLRSNTSMQSEGYEHVSDVTRRVRQEWEDIRSGKISPYINSGWPSLETNYLFPAGEIAIVHGLSGSGKSTLVFQILLGTAIGLYHFGKPGCVAFNSLEMTAERLVERMAGILAHLDLTKLKTGNMSTTDFNTLMEWTEFIDQLPIFVDDTNFLTTTAMQYRASGLHVSPNGPVIQIASDYAELFADEDNSKEQKVSKVFREQFALSRMIGASVLAISQSTVDASVSGKTYIAGADGIRYSKGGLHAADVVVELWNPIQIEKAGRQVILGDGSSLSKDAAYMLIQKRRSGAVGEDIKLGWVPEHTTFFDPLLKHKPNYETLYSFLDDAVNKWKGITGSW